MPNPRITTYPDKQAAEIALLEFGFAFDRHESWAFSHGVDFYYSRRSATRAAIFFSRERGSWAVQYYDTRDGEVSARAC